MKIVMEWLMEIYFYLQMGVYLKPAVTFWKLQKLIQIESEQL